MTIVIKASYYHYYYYYYYYGREFWAWTAMFLELCHANMPTVDHSENPANVTLGRL